MPKILITGNGFDLNLNLPTSYSDFIKILSNLKDIKEYNFDSIYNASSSYESIKKKFDNSIRFKKNEIDELKDLLNKSLWFNFFTSEYNIDTWIDFETKIEYVLINIFKSLNSLEEILFSKGPRVNSAKRISAIHFNKDIVRIEIFNSFNLLKKDGINYILNELLFINKYGYNVNFNYETISKYLFEDLLIFKKIFNLYFELFVLPLYDKLQQNINSTIYKDIDYHFTFNYTPTFEKVYDQTIRTDFLHGKIDSINNFIVLGINDLPNNVNEEHLKYFIPFTKYYQKLNNNTDYYFLNEISNKNSSEDYIFYFVGHSLDRSDEDYINEIFDFVYDSKSKKSKIVIAYHSENSKSSMLINLFLIRGKDDIVELMRSKVLVFKKLNTKEFDELINPFPLLAKPRSIKNRTRLRDEDV